MVEVEVVIEVEATTVLLPVPVLVVSTVAWEEHMAEVFRVPEVVQARPFSLRVDSVDALEQELWEA